MIYALLTAILCLLWCAPVEAVQLTPKEELGKLLYFDPQLSMGRNQSCSTCHLPPGFADPENVANPRESVVSKGSLPGKLGTRNSPSAAYAAFSPHFHWNGEEGLYVGGQFWDGREPTLKAQAKGPFLNHVEMGMISPRSVKEAVRDLVNPFQPKYLALFGQVYNVSLDTVNLTEPLVAEMLYDMVADAIAAYEKSSELNQFNSKFDYYLAGKAKLTPQERLGLTIFNGKGLCNKCHISTSLKSPDGGIIPPLFTDFTYDNLGIPRSTNPAIAQAKTDYGLGGRPDIAALDPKGTQKGKFKVPTLRNVALTAPYGHNGFFATLTEIVDFYNTAGIRGRWPKPEVAQNVNREEMGNLKLTKREVAALVAFMQTLSDGYGKLLPKITLPPFP